MRFTNFAILIFILLVLGACSAKQQRYAFESGQIYVQANLVADEYADIETSIRADQVANQTYPDVEWRELLNIDAIFDMSIERLKLISKFDMSGVSPYEVEFLWQQVKEGYKKARSIVAPRMSAYQPETKARLRVFDKQAIAVGDQIEKLLSDPTNDNITQALTLITSVLSLAAKVLGAGLIL